MAGRGLLSQRRTTEVHTHLASSCLQNLISIKFNFNIGRLYELEQVKDCADTSVNQFLSSVYSTRILPQWRRLVEERLDLPTWLARIVTTNPV